LHRIIQFVEPSGNIPAYIEIEDISDVNDVVNTVDAGNFVVGLKYKITSVGNTNWISIGASSNTIGVTFVATGMGSGTGKATPIGIHSPFSITASTTLRAGIISGREGQVTVKISTCRATGHDFLDIGTGGYNSTNFPTAIYGNPAREAQQNQEVVEEFKGRVFYTSTDQDGVFRVGRFFSVDQGTGTVTFAASIALSNLDGLGFKRGVVVAEFSTDNTMTNNASDAVPTQSATRGYIDRRLGLDHTGVEVPFVDRIGPGYMPLNGALAMSSNLNLDGNRILNVGAPLVIDDAATKGYVDAKFSQTNELSEGTDVLVVTPAGGDLLAYTGAGSATVSSGTKGDISSAFSSDNTTTLAVGITGINQIHVSLGITVANIAGFPTSGYIQIGQEIFSYSSIDTGNNKFNGVNRLADPDIDENLKGKFSDLVGCVASTHNVGAAVIGLNNAKVDLQINPGVIVNADVNNNAAIAQSKLAMLDATANTLISAVKGIASFDSTNFEVTNGWVGIKAGGVSLSEIANIGVGAVIGNLTGAAAAPQELSTSNVVSSGLEGLTSTSGNGAVVRTAANTFTSVSITTNGGNNSLVRTSASGTIDVKGVSLNSNSVLELDTTRLKVKTPGGMEVINAVGADATGQVILTGQFTLSPGSTLQSSSAQTSVNSTNADNLNVGGTYRAASTSATNNTIAARTGSGDLYANIFYGIATSARYADLAEYYSSDKDYEPGTVLVFGGSAEVTTTNIFGDAKLAGVVSTDPAYIMNDGLQGIKSCIALQGRVPVKVVGKVKKGDMLTTAGVPGCAAKAIDPRIGTIIGKALEDKDTTDIGIIEVAVGRV